jgi:hypothetical protein
MAKKSTEIEIYNRIHIVAEMILKGYNKENIVRFASENWQIGERQTEEYIKRAHEIFVNEARIDQHSEHLGKSIMQLMDLYKKSYAIQDYAECRRIIKDVADLIGFGAAKKIEQQLKVEDITPPIKWS